MTAQAHQMLRSCLTLSGALPFLFCASCLVLGVDTLPVIGSVETVLTSYALVIVTFMAGVHWGQQFGRSDHWGRTLPLTSNVITLGVWGAFLFLSAEVQIWVFTLAFVGLIYLDARLYRDGVIDAAYFRLRCVVTLLVVSSLAVAGARV